MLPASLYHLRDAFRKYAKHCAPDIQAFCGEALEKDHEEKEITTSTLAMVEKLPELKKLAHSATDELVARVLDAVHSVQWRQSYTVEDEGIDQNYLKHYGWFNLIAPSGPFLSSELRLSIGYWGKGLQYPTHWHEPEEIYLTLAGTLIYHSQGRASVEGGPGTTVSHYSNQPHGADFSLSPVLVAAFWRGNNLENESIIGKANSDGT